MLCNKSLWEYTYMHTQIDLYTQIHICTHIIIIMSHPSATNKGINDFNRRQLTIKTKRQNVTQKRLRKINAL